MKRMAIIAGIALALVACEEAKPEMASAELKGISPLKAVSNAKADEANQEALEGSSTDAKPPKQPKQPTQPKKPTPQ